MRTSREHAPWLNFTNVPPAVSMPMGAFTGDGALPTVSFVVPDLDNDMHNGSVATADAWLAGHLAGYADKTGRTADAAPVSGIWAS